jgi:hypothetical protein
MFAVRLAWLNMSPLNGVSTYIIEIFWWLMPVGELTLDAAAIIQISALAGTSRSNSEATLKESAAEAVGGTQMPRRIGSARIEWCTAAKST